MKFHFNFRFLLLAIGILVIQMGVCKFLSGKEYGLFIEFLAGISKLVFLFSSFCAFSMIGIKYQGILQLVVCTVVLFLFQCIFFKITESNVYNSLGILTGGVMETLTFIDPFYRLLNPKSPDLPE